MTDDIRELDVVEVVADLPEGFVEGARGAVVAVHEDTCTVEFVDAEGFTIGLFELPKDKLHVVERSGASIGREE